MTMGINTGTPGFDIDGKTYTYDVGDPNRPYDPNNYPVFTDHGDIHVDDNDPPTKDLSNTTKLTLADYLGKKTQINRYPVDGSPVNPIKITGIGNTTPSMPSDIDTTTNNAHFPLPRMDVGNPTYAGVVKTSPGLRSWMNNTGTGDTRPFVPPDVSLTSIKKGKQQRGAENIDGNVLLPQVIRDNLGTLERYTSAVLSNNRFTSTAKYADFDVETPAAGYNPTMQSPKYGGISSKRLAQVGVSLSIRSSRELNSAAENSNPTSAGTEAKALLPSFNQLGVSKIDTFVLSARDVMQDLSGDEIPDANYISLGKDSWGALNNVYDTFSGITSLGMIALSTALCAGVTILFEGLAGLLSLAKGSPDPRKNPDGRHILGRSTVSKMVSPNAFPPGFPPDIGALLGIRPTINPFSECLRVGTFAFFGIDADIIGGGISGAGVVSGLRSAASSPGYNAVTARAIIRSITVVIDSIKKIFSSANLVSGVKNLLGMMDTLRSSKLISALNVFSMLGDMVLTDDPENVVQGRPEEPLRKSSIDKIGDNVPAAAVRKNRIGNGRNLKLAWASNRSPSLYLLPSAFAGLAPVAGALGAFQSGFGLQESETRSYYKLLNASESKTNGNRIPHDSPPSMDIDSLRKIEDALEAEYIPFYFHDVRTNEVISFHAFIASLTDDFSSNYEHTDGFGRVEPVKIYKSTTRKISISFHIAATSPADFDDMWVKINKLVTLVYPQYTEGRWLNTLQGSSKYKFTQPFSQMIGASPLIRLRLGNLISSNYSRFALARLFGATLGGAQFGGDPLVLDGSPAKNLKNKVRDTIKAGEQNVRWFIAGGISLDAQQAGGGENKNNAPTWVVADDAMYIPVAFASADKDDPDVVYVRPEVPTAAFLKDALAITDPTTQASIIKHIEGKYNRTTDIKNRIIGGTYGVRASFMRPTREVMKRINNEAFGGGSSAVEDLTEFLDVDKNALAKSFRSAGGKGLAGFIDSMNFDWNERVKWDTDPDRKAPMMCKVTLSFSPIHDISPGIDSQGFNRAPIYPIAFHMHGNDEAKK